MGMKALQLSAIVTSVLLASCGYRGDLTHYPVDREADSQREEAERDARKAARAEEKKMVREGLRVPSTTNPERIDELRVPLQERAPDPFALPPEGSHAESAPFPEHGEDAQKGDDRFLEQRH